eukprot:TRINITY_DN45665_c0_g1_i1.p1 TRINITY_DN45665_c0_g1~~TRINITY_DN45665_c0_g1_i1.p1  ORF type:complete len:181 (+),score=35.98 TRINITY_DN45665_c0_g1_i1:192-734(+)
MMEDEFHALNGSAAWVHCNRDKLDLILHEIPALEARLSHAQQNTDMLAANLLPLLDQLSACRPEMAALSTFAEQLSASSLMTQTRCDHLEALQAQVSVEAQQCAHQAETCVQELQARLVHERERAGSKEAGSSDEAQKLRVQAVSYTHLRAHETPEHLVCRLLLEKKKNPNAIANQAIYK